MIKSGNGFASATAGLKDKDIALKILRLSFLWKAQHCKPQ